MTGYDETNDISVAAELGRQAARAAAVEPYDLSETDSVVLRVTRNDERIEALDLEKLLDAPHRPRGYAEVTDPMDFVAYVKRLAGPATTVWGYEGAHTFTAVFNDHTDAQAAGWRDHTAVLRLRTDPDFDQWFCRDGKLGGQAEFAEHLESLAHTVVEPDAATMLELALTFQARRNSTFSRGTRLESGDVQLAWSEETTATAGASGRLDVPERFTLRVAPFLGSTAVELTARLRYRVRDGVLAIGYRLHRPDLAIRESFADISKAIASGLDAPVIAGRPPQPVCLR